MSRLRLTGMGRTVAHMMMTLPDNVEILSAEDDEMALENAAFNSRLPGDKMTSQELACFPDVAKDGKFTQKVYLYLRNKILQLWLNNCREELTYEKVVCLIPTPYNSDTGLILRIHSFLSRYSYINFGFYTFEKITTKKKCHVIVLGGGAAGLAAARQLEGFGCAVTVIEARKRVGGRVCTYKKANLVADLGAMVVTGLGGNPLTVLAKQFPLDLQKVKMKCPLFDVNGRPIEKEKDELIEKEYNRLLEAAAHLAHTKGLNELNGEKCSLGDVLELLIRLQEKRVKERRVEYWQTILLLQEKVKEIQADMVKERNRMETLKCQYEELDKMRQKENSQTANPIVDEFHFLSKRRDLNAACNNFDVLSKARDELENNIMELSLRQNKPSDVYMSTLDRKILDWHLANLEFANATSLHNLSLKYWDQDDDFEFTGSHLTVTDGYSTVTERLAEGLDIKLKSVAQKITYNAQGVEVVVTSIGDDDRATRCPASTTIQGDAVICTVPLGVLKECVGEESEKGPGSIVFDPPLPDWKIQAINRLGFGNLNKVVLCFDKIFWDQNTNLFGHINETTAGRGEMFLFWSLSTTSPVLVALISGKSADALEKWNDDTIVQRCVKILSDIFGSSVTEPKEAVVTRWRSDPWARGSYSYVGIDASGDDYDLLAAPVCPPGSSKDNRVFFAGEHTIRNYPATVHGAIISGFREAGRVADQFLECPYAPQTNE